MNITEKETAYDTTIVKQKHSGIGIASFSMSVVAGCLILLSLVSLFSSLAAVDSIDNLKETYYFFIGLLIILALIIDIIAIGLGIAGLVQKDRKKILSLLGVLFSLSFFVVTVFAIILSRI